jgi:hypothetical protein
MPLTSEVSRTDFIGNGSVSAYSTTFPCKSATEVRVFTQDANGQDVELFSPAGFTAVLNADGTVTVTLTAGNYTNGYKGSLQRGIPYTQTYNPVAAGAYNPASLGTALDRLAMEIVRMKGDLARAIKIPYLEAGGDSVTKLVDNAAARALQGVVFDASGNIGVGSPVNATASPFAQTLLDDTTADAMRNTLGLPSQAMAARTVVANDTAGAANGAAVAVDDLTVLADGSTTRRDLSARFSDVINVKDYGATGDGVTDDTAKLQEAATFAGTSGRSLFIPGTSSYYKLSDTISIPAGVTVYGAGLKSRIKQTAREKNVFSLANDCVLDGLNIEGDGSSSTGIDFTKNNGVVISGVRNCVVRNCFIHAFEFNGVFLQNALNCVVSSNIFWDNKYSNETSADIICYSGTEGGRVLITGNRCFSNNSEGIFFDAQGFDHDCVISDNICITLDASTWAEVSSGSLLRRHGVMLGYNGGTGRYLVSGNICRNTRQTGIYYQSATVPTSAVQIIGNQCSLNGVNPIDPSLAAGIYAAAQGKGDLIMGNAIDDFTFDTEFANGGIAVKPSVPGQVAANASTLVIGNTIRRSGCHGIIMGGYAIRVSVSDNSIVDSARSDICWSPIAATANVGELLISGNRVVRNNTNSPAVELDFQSSTLSLYVRNNHLTGSNSATNSAQNSGVKWSQAAPKIHVTDNIILGFYHGVYQSNFISGRSFTAQYIDRNTFETCTNGIMVAGTSTDPVLPVQDNVFINVTTKVSGAALGFDVVKIAQRFGDKIYFQESAIPTTGTWAVGDRVQQLTPSVGSPKGWVCTVAGTPGTWVSEGNL